MADPRNVIGLLYRADWTQLSLSADVRFERHGDLGGYHSGPAALLIAPGRCYRLEYRDERTGYVEGSDGDHGWIWWDQALPSPKLIDVGHEPPFPELFCPSALLSGFTLDVRGPVTAAGRDAIAVTATPRSGAIGSGPALRDPLCDRVEVIVDAELGIVLRREETFGGQRLTLTELTAVTRNPPEAAGPARFAPPPGSHVSQDRGEGLRDTSGGPGRQTARNAAGRAAGGLGALIRFAPNLASPEPAGENDPEATMPSPEPGPLAPPGPPLASDDLPYLLYRSGQAPDLGPPLHQWHDLAAMLARVPETARAAGQGGVGYLLDAATRAKTVTHTVARLRVSGRDRYRIDYRSRSGRTNPKTVACDGEHRWQVYQAKTMVGAVAPPPHDIANLIDSSWLFGCQLSGGSEITYRGRRAYQLRVTPGDAGPSPGPLLFFPADAIVGAGTGCLHRLISYAGERPASWWELRDFAAEPGGPGDFRLDVPPGVQVVEETGKPIDDAAAVMPGMSGYAVRTAADVVRRTAGAVSATRSFLRGRSQPPGSG